MEGRLSIFIPRLLQSHIIPFNLHTDKREGDMQTAHISIPDDLHDWLKAEAAKDERSIRGLILKIIRDKKREQTNDEA